MKEEVHSSNSTQSEKVSPLAYVMSVVFIGITVVSIASIMGCSLP